MQLMILFRTSLWQAVDRYLNLPEARAALGARKEVRGDRGGWGWLGWGRGHACMGWCMAATTPPPCACVGCLRVLFR